MYNKENLTYHAQMRMQQRAIPQEMISLLSRLDSLANTYMVIGDNGQILTVGHKY